MVRQEFDQPGNEVISAQRLRKRFNEWGVQIVCCDLDGTLWDTRSLYHKATLEAVGFLFFGEGWPQVLGDNQEEKIRRVKDFTEVVIETVIPSLRPEFEVRPQIMEMAILVAARILGSHENSFEVGLAIERIQGLFHKDVPEIFRGAGEMLATINAALDGREQKLCLATHAAEEWVRHKLDKTRLAGSFARPPLYFDTSLPKSVQWERKIEALGIKAEQLFVIGDNVNADLKVPVEMGARGIWVINNQPESRLRLGEAGLREMEEGARRRILRADETQEIIKQLLK